MKKVEGSFIYQDNDGHIFLKFENLHPYFDLDEVRIGEYNSFAIDENTQVLIFVESWDLPGGPYDILGGVYPPDGVEWTNLGSLEDDNRGYRLWDTGIRLPRGIWQSAAI